MANSKDLAQNATPSILVVGDGGTEKTRFLAGCPKPFILDFDNGMRSTREFAVEYETFKDAPYVKPKAGVSKWDLPGVDKDRGIYPWGESWPRFIDYLNETMWPKLEAGNWDFLTLGIDSITTMANQAMNYVLKGAGLDGSAQPRIQDWGAQLRLMEVVIEQLSAWPVMLVMTAHVKRDDNLISGEREYLPLVGGQLGAKIGIYFDEVYYTKPDGSGTTRKVLAKTEAAGLYKMAKSRDRVPDGTPLKWASIEPYIMGKK